MNSKILAPALAAATMMGFYAHADRSQIPSNMAVGPNISTLAGVCAMGDQHGTGFNGTGPLAQTSKAGRYNGICAHLTNAEICFAYIKRHLGRDGQMQTAAIKERAEYCVEHFAEELGI